MPVNYDVPAIFSEDYIEGLKMLQKKGDDKIKSVYGSVRNFLLGQARYSNKIPELNNSELGYFIKKIKDLGISFHYTINSPWSELKERKNKNDFIKELEILLNLGIDALILANPFLIKTVKETFPETKIIGSINLQVNTVYKYNSLLQYGCESVVLDRPVNRNIRMLKKLSRNAERFSLLVNSTCLFDCPLQQYHANENGFFSRGGAELIEDPSYCMKYCVSEIQNNPVNILKSTWIRPEDITKYESIGVKNFKIQGRTLSTNALMGIISAYLERKTPDDRLFYIFPEWRKSFPEIDTKLKGSVLDKMEFIDYFFKSNVDCSIDCLNCNYCHSLFQALS